jgi:hypothetical protein
VISEYNNSGSAPGAFLIHMLPFVDRPMRALSTPSVRKMPLDLRVFCNEQKIENAGAFAPHAFVGEYVGAHPKSLWRQSRL